MMVPTGVLIARQQASAIEWFTKWVGGKTALGYMKDTNDKNKLIICEPEAEVVKTIFDMALAGNEVGTIKNYLNDNKIPTASQLRYNKATFWENKTVKNILKNEVYCRNNSAK